MWDRPMMRWVAIPAIFLAVGPPAGGVVLFVLSIFIIGPFAPFAGLPLLLVASYPVGGVQALLTGLVAAATVRRGEGVRALPPALASIVIGLLVSGVAAIAADEAGDAEEGFGPFVNGATLLAVHLAGALAGIGACRWIERRRSLTAPQPPMP